MKLLLALAWLSYLWQVPPPKHVPYSYADVTLAVICNGTDDGPNIQATFERGQAMQEHTAPQYPGAEWSTEGAILKLDFSASPSCLVKGSLDFSSLRHTVVIDSEHWMFGRDLIISGGMFTPEEKVK